MIRALLRLLVAAFCWLTAVYAFVASSAFAYQQFLRPRVFRSVGLFGDWHALLYWMWLLLAIASIGGEWRRGRRSRPFAVTFVLVWMAIGVWLAAQPVLPTLVDDHRSVVVGVLALLPILWLAGIDHLSAADYLRRQTLRESLDDLASREARLFAAAIGTAVLVVVLYAILTPLAIGAAFEPDLLTMGLTFGLMWNLLDHLVVFCPVFLALALVERALVRLPGFRGRYAGVFTVFTLMVAVVVQRLFGTAIGLDGPWGTATALALSVSIVSTWAAICIQSAARADVRLTSGLDAFFGAADVSGRGIYHGVSLCLVAGMAYGLAVMAGRHDWDFLLLKLGVFAVWVVAFVRIYRGTPPRRRAGGAVVAVVCALPIVGHALEARAQARLPLWLDDRGLSVRHTLDRYVVYNPSFRFADSLLSERTSDTPSFDRFLRAHTGLASSVSPISVDFVPSLAPAPADAKPLIFLFVIDSLRPDYLRPYNAAVGFTPRIDAFAADSLVFRNAFTRYGGTGLSVSSIWMGAAGPHKQYVQPFRPMNALEKLLDANRYRRLVSPDHIMTQLLTPSAETVELDRGIPEMQYDLCRTLEEIQRELHMGAAGGQPVFAHTRPLNLHVAAIRSDNIPPGRTYPGFEPRYAARVQQMDACFGTFIDGLKRRGVYDRSIIIVTADHGEMLGEDGRWGHAYYLFPGVVQIPLIMHLPPSIRRTAGVDAEAISFSTDITPTLYAALGYLPRPVTPLMGQSLIGPPGADFSARRRATEVVIASYGAVYGALSQNGHRLYIADGNHQTEYAFERSGREWSAVPVTGALRGGNQRAIREYLEEIAREYHVSVTY